jgi:hypothetical protein
MAEACEMATWFWPDFATMASRAEISGVNCRQMGLGKLTELAVIGSCRLASQNIALIFLIGPPIPMGGKSEIKGILSVTNTQSS